jgi:2',3'-cyclic-nucleotide 2'-phosphodiesterase (5'-nucleotidase family)
MFSFRPPTAVGTFLRMITVNDVYKLDNYPYLASAVNAARSTAKDVDCVVTSHLPGDFVSPALITSLDGGRAMIEGMNLAQIDYACLGNHEFDLGFEGLASVVKGFRGTIINSNVTHPLFTHELMPRFATVRVGERWCVYGGFLTDDRSIYAPSRTPNAAPIAASCAELWEAACTELRADGRLGPSELPALFVPMTHQLTPLDRQTAQALAKHPQLGARMPVILGGHDHEVFIDEAGKTIILKVGADAERIGIVDIWWTAEGVLSSSVSLLPAKLFPPEPTAQAFSKKTEAFIRETMDVTIATLPAPMSSKQVRFEESDMATFLLSLLKKGLHSDGVEMVILQGGAVRAGKDYAAGPFTIGDLFNELAFETHQAIIELPGHIIADSVANTRALPKPAPNFLHLDSECVVEQRGEGGEVTHALVKIDGQPLEPDRLYRVSLYQMLLTGLNVIEPLMTYVKANVQVPSEESCCLAKDVILATCMKAAWRELVGLHTEDTSGVHVSRDALLAELDVIFSSLDTNGHGYIDSSDLQAFMTSHGELAKSSLVAQMLTSLDTDADGRISRNALSALAF